MNCCLLADHNTAVVAAAAADRSMSCCYLADHSNNLGIVVHTHHLF